MTLTLTTAQIDRLKELSVRDHHGEVVIDDVVLAGLDYVQVTVLLTDMGDKTRPLHTFLLSPRGVLTKEDSYHLQSSPGGESEICVS